VLGSLRLGLVLLAAVGVGYALGSRPFAELVEDEYHVLALERTKHRFARGANGLSSFFCGPDHPTCSASWPDFGPDAIPCEKRR